MAAVVGTTILGRVVPRDGPARDTVGSEYVLPDLVEGVFRSVIVGAADVDVLAGIHYRGAVRIVSGIFG
jgi:hypothetical protein